MKSLTDFLRMRVKPISEKLITKGSLVSEGIKSTETNKKILSGENYITETYDLFRKISEKPSLLKKEKSSRA